MELIARYQSILARIDRACLAAGRNREEVRLIVVSKTFGLEPMRILAEQGQVDFGESYAQELRDKAPQLDVRWHFIGRLQSNKARYVAPHAYRVHALASDRHATALAKRSEHPVPALVAVNIGREPQKDGVVPEDALALCRSLQERDDVALHGLMCIPPAGEPSAPHYRALADLARQGRAEGLPLNELSMGMSSDFEEAIAQGATWIRVGSAIFGPRG